MKLTKTQRKVLKFYARHRTAAPTLPTVLRGFVPSWLLLAVLAVASTWFIWAGWPVVAWLYIGVFAGVVLRDIGRIRILFHTWSVLHAVLDWERIQQILASDDTNAV